MKIINTTTLEKHRKKKAIGIIGSEGRMGFDWGSHFWHSVFLWATGVAALFGGIGIAAAFVAGMVGYQITEFSLEKGRAEQRAANIEIATANERAANANRIAEGERLERLKLEEKLAPRTLTDEQGNAIVDHLRPFAGARVDIVVFPEGSADILPLAQALAQIIETAGWKFKMFVTMGARRWVKGIVVRTFKNASEEQQEQALALLLALQGQRLSVAKVADFESFDLGSINAAGVNGPPWDVDDAAPIRIEIGTKP